MRLGASPAHPDLSRSGRSRARSGGDLAVEYSRRGAAALKDIGAQSVAAIGITNQRRDDDRVGARHRQAARQCHRVAGPAHREALRELKGEGWGAHVEETTGLVIDPYFSGPSSPGCYQCTRASRAGAQRRSVLRHGRQLSPVQADRRGEVHAIEASDAARTMLYDIKRGASDDSFSTASQSRAKFCRSSATARTISV